MIYVILDPKTPADIISDNAIILLRAGVGLKDTFPNGHEIPSLSEQCAQSIARQLVTSIDLVLDIKVKRAASFLVNDYFSYALAPALSIIVALDEAVTQNPGLPVVVCSPTRTKGPLPFWGYKTLESPHGSPTLLCGHVTNLLNCVFPEIDLRMASQPSDKFYFEPFRRLWLWTMDRAFHINLLMKLLWLSVFRVSPNQSAEWDTLVVVRSPHQARFGQKMLQTLNLEKPDCRAAVLVFPQLSTLSFSSFRNLVDQQLKNTPQFRISILSMLRAVGKSIAETRVLRRGADLSIVFQVGNRRVPFQLSDMIKEMTRIRASFTYSHLVAEGLRTSRADRLVSFETVGRVTGLEAMRAEELDVTYRNVQTILVSATPLPVFPVGQEFYADSVVTLDRIRNIGAKKNGEILFEGSPYPVADTVKQAANFRTLSFFTQPDETDVTEAILKSLIAWSAPRSARILLRLHPRDSGDGYKVLLDQYPETIMLDMERPLSQVISDSDVCLTRTSSVAKDILAAGIPLVLCIWSRVNRSFKADFIQDFIDTPYISYDATDLDAILDAPENVGRAAVLLRQSFWEGKSYSTLLERVFS